MINFPDSPPNGTEIIDRRDDGSVIIWTYNENKNEWTHESFGDPRPVKIFTQDIENLAQRVFAVEEILQKVASKIS